MALFKRVTVTDHGLSKKSDSPDLQPTNPTSMRLFPWNALRRRRFIVAFLLILATYLFVHNIPTDVVPVSQRYNSIYGSMASGHTKAHMGQYDKTSSVRHEEGQSNGYEGPIRFTNLASTLRTFASAYSPVTVLFPLLHAASASHVLPLACRMTQHGLNSVHVAMMGNLQGSFDEIMQRNGVDTLNCPVIWHDARPDRVRESSVLRIWASVQQGYSYLHRGLNPSIVMVDGSGAGDASLLRALEAATTKIGAPVFRVPEKVLEKMAWISMLEGPLINLINQVEVEIVVQAYSESAGSLIKLLRSLRNANYDGLPIPKLTIELPSHTDPFVTTYLSRFKWPPKATVGAGQLTIRRRIDFKQISVAEAALRSVESFYPVNPIKSHVLMLSPDMELSANYMHYLIFSILHFRHGQRSVPYNNQLFGISLELPSKSIDDTQSFLNSSMSQSGPFLLSQSPNTRAGLFFGDRWIELHKFLSKRLLFDPQLKQVSSTGAITVGHGYPQWTRQALELMQARGLYMLYPAFARDGRSQIAVLHEDPHHHPDEFSDEEEEEEDLAAEPAVPTDSAWLPKSGVLDGYAAPHQRTLESLQPGAEFTLPPILLGDTHGPSENVVSPLVGMSLHSVHGDVLDWYDAERETSKYADEFSLRGGGCTSLDARDATKTGSIDFLFCEPG